MLRKCFIGFVVLSSEPRRGFDVSSTEPTVSVHWGSSFSRLNPVVGSTIVRPNSLCGPGAFQGCFALVSLVFFLLFFALGFLGSPPFKAWLLLESCDVFRPVTVSLKTPLKGL